MRYTLRLTAQTLRLPRPTGEVVLRRDAKLAEVTLGDITPGELLRLAQAGSVHFMPDEETVDEGGNGRTDRDTDRREGVLPRGGKGTKRHAERVP